MATGATTTRTSRPEALETVIAPRSTSTPAADSAPVHGRPRVRNAPSPAWPGVDLRELWEFRELFLFLVWRDIKARYAQTVLGPGWAVIRPLLTMVLLTLVFGKLAKVPSEGVPYTVFSLAGVVIWNYCSTAFTAASGSLVTNRNLVTKVYFPRLVIPFAPVFATLVDFAIAFVILIAMTLAFGIVPTGATLVLPLLVLSMMMIAGGVGCWLAALNVQFRDVQHLTPFAAQIWMYASPIAYPMSLVPEEYRWLFVLNPVTGIVEGFRAAILGTGPMPWDVIGIGILGSSMLFVTGVLYFRHTERIFADVA